MTRTELEARVIEHMRRRYEEVAHDLPRHGQGHNAAALDHAADNAHDTFGRQSYADWSYSRLAKRALRTYLSSDEYAATRRNERRAARVPRPRPVKTAPPPRPRKATWAERGRIRARRPVAGPPVVTG